MRWRRPNDAPCTTRHENDRPLGDNGDVEGIGFPCIQKHALNCAVAVYVCPEALAIGAVTRDTADVRPNQVENMQLYIALVRNKMST